MMSFEDLRKQAREEICQGFNIKGGEMKTPILQKHNPQQEIGICEINYEADWITITLNDGKGIASGNLLNISLGSVEVLEYAAAAAAKGG